MPIIKNTIATQIQIAVRGWLARRSVARLRAEAAAKMMARKPRTTKPQPDWSLLASGTPVRIVLKRTPVEGVFYEPTRWRLGAQEFTSIGQFALAAVRQVSPTREAVNAWTSVQYLRSDGAWVLIDEIRAERVEAEVAMPLLPASPVAEAEEGEVVAAAPLPGEAPADGQRYQILIGGEALAVKKKGNSLGLGCASLAADALIFECRHITEGKHAGFMEFVVADGPFAGKRLDKWYRENPKGKDLVKIYRAIDIMPQNPAQRWRADALADGSGFRLTPFCSPGKYLTIGEDGLARGSAEGAVVTFIPI
jgi:hypothetical protein